MAAVRPQELMSALSQHPAPFVVDVRSREEFVGGSIPGARNLPWSDELADALARELPRDARIVFVCAWGHRSVVASIAMRRHGFRHVGFLEGGLEAWGLAGQPLGSGDSASRQ